MRADMQKYLIHPIERPVDDSEAKVDLIRSKDNPIMGCFYESCYYRHDYVICDTMYALPYVEFFCFSNTAHDNHNLGATLSMDIGGQKFVTDQNCMIQVPAFVPHGNITITDVKSPVFSFVTGEGREHTTLPKDVWLPGYDGPLSEITLFYNGDTIKFPNPNEYQEPVMRSTANKTMKGDISSSLRRWLKTDGWDYVGFAHMHNTPEILAYYGCDAWHPFELGGTYTQCLNGESFIIDRPTLVYLPPYLPHCPIRVHKLERDNFWHSAGLATGADSNHPEYALRSLGMQDGVLEDVILEEPW